jgi:transglutaminase-like putative cysteine protease
MIQSKKLIFICILLLFVYECSNSGESDENIPGKAGKTYYGIEINGVLCGFVESTVNHIEKDGKKMIQAKRDLFLMLTALGSKFNTEKKILYNIDPETNKCNYYSIDFKQGDMNYNTKIEMKDNTAIITPFMSEKSTEIKITPDIIFSDEQLLKHLRKDFSDGVTKEKTYRILEPMEGKILTSIFKKLRTEKIKLVGKTYNADVFNQFVKETGVKGKWWCDLDKSSMLKLEIGNQKVFRTDHRVVNKIKVANMDESIFTKTNVSIADIHAISYMKLEVQIEPTGAQLTPADLNTPGQRFTGTVKDNLIDGILEIEYKKYNGENAPAFPPDYSNDESLREYLLPGKLIGSNDPVLVKKAKEITNGSQDSWEATRRLSKWVAENITYGIPGGVTARKTYDMRAGECGAHSCLTAAFCRAVGIPARVVWGAMYVQNYRGGFGQHAWNEIYMGENGWIPIDTTTYEEDFLDSGHIRIAERLSASIAFNGKKIKILDYRLDKKEMNTAISGSEFFKQYIGEYKNTASKNIVNVKIQDGNLVVDIPGKVILPLNEPDETGAWYCKLAKQLYFIFKEDDSGKVTDMHLHQILNAQKKSGLKEADDNVPEKYKPYLGTYYLAAANLNIKVLYENGTLAVDDPTQKEKIKLKPTGEKDKYIDQYNKNTLFFESDDKGNIKNIKIDVLEKFKRI